MILGEVIFLDNQMNEFICFADFEFTCGLPVTKGKSEMLSVGIVICDISMNIAETFYSTSKPNHFPKLTKRCIEITHLSQDEINASQDSQIVLEKVIGLLKKYSVSSLYVWGNFDKTGLQCDALMHRKHELKSDAILKISQKIIDIQPSLTKEMGLPYAINIKDLSSVFGYVPESGTYHNALNDAMALFYIYKSVKSGEYAVSQSFLQLLDDTREKQRQNKLRVAEINRIRQEENERLFMESIADYKPTEKEFIIKCKNDKAYGLKKSFYMTRKSFFDSFMKYPRDSKFIVIYDAPSAPCKVFPESIRNEESVLPATAKIKHITRENYEDALIEISICLCNKFKKTEKNKKIIIKTKNNAPKPHKTNK